MQGTNDFDLAVKYKGSPDQVKRFIKNLRDHEGLPSRDKLSEDTSFEYKGLKERKQFLEFLHRARTKPEIIKAFGAELAEHLLDDSFEGYSFFTQINDFGELTYILLPKIEKTWTVKERAFEYHHSQSEHGNYKQPYQLVQFPDSAFANEEECVSIIPLYDVHFGHHAHKKEKFLSYIRYIEEHDNIYTFIGGDLQENALDDGRGMTYEQEIPPAVQVEEMIPMLAPIAHKILFILTGNHCSRSYKKAGLDPSKVIADTLDIPHFDGPVYCSMLGNNHRWRMYAFHGFGNSQTKGGKMNMAGKPKKFTDFIHFFVSGHVHDCLATPETCIAEDPLRCRLIYPQQYTIVCPSFLGYENTYAYRAGYAPPGGGGAVLKLYANGDYEAIHKNR